MDKTLTIDEWVDHLHAADLPLTIAYGESGLKRLIKSPDLHRPGLALAGHFFHYHPERIQILGETEITFLDTRSSDQRLEVFSEFARAGVPAFIITRGLPVPEELQRCCTEEAIPILRTDQPTGDFLRPASRLLIELLAPSTIIHGVMVDVLGIGVLLRGPSGIGKSESALEIVLRGHRLVADDMVEIRRLPSNELQGRSVELIKHHMEIRGLGIINVQDLFGVAAVRDEKRLELIVHLEHWDPEAYYDRLGMEGPLTEEILGVAINRVNIPIRPGRNLSEIIEVAARNHILKMRGVDSAKRFQKKLLNQIAGSEQMVHSVASAAEHAARTGPDEPAPESSGEGEQNPDT